MGGKPKIWFWRPELYVNLKGALLVILVSFALSSIATAVIAREINQRIQPLESRMRILERDNGRLSAALQVEAVKRQNEVQRVDEAQARNFNALQPIINQQADRREELARYFQSQSLFLAARVEAENGRVNNAQSLAIAGMAMATNSSIIGCRNAQSTIVRVTDQAAIPVLISLLRGSMYEIEPLAQVQPNLTEVRVTPVKFLPGC